MHLTVIKPHKEIVYLLDSLSHRIRDEDWKYVVEMALRLFNSNNGRKGRKYVQWEVIKAPRQPDAKQCGYYVMRFMRQITEEIAMIEGDTLPSIFTKAEYSQEEIDEVHSEIAEFDPDNIFIDDIVVQDILEVASVIDRDGSVRTYAMETKPQESLPLEPVESAVLLIYDGSVGETEESLSLIVPNPEPDPYFTKMMSHSLF
ncbi:uncharacterized protein LOC121978371 [Zingiber officinale]|uniref:uncharacterized protein LOC121978371 n=1 Tax=Zingiber officinale TaxID=94328 RepID=UPI001C4B2B44|nr:uncharacterized protein LOC121978371 [Zingiber officinale]